ncbi:hypothetical protein T492DRAFT_1148689 [Pavlovales sp. CCMP2436]|nr:hypothetical protein T492DRAFT_1148689 [Pavlovales sp. CCMP2436]
MCYQERTLHIVLSSVSATNGGNENGGTYFNGGGNEIGGGKGAGGGQNRPAGVAAAPATPRLLIGSFGQRELLLHQLRLDCALLEKHEIMDYSLLLGVADGEQHLRAATPGLGACIPYLPPPFYKLRLTCPIPTVQIVRNPLSV